MKKCCNCKYCKLKYNKKSDLKYICSRYKFSAVVNREHHCKYWSKGLNNEM